MPRYEKLGSKKENVYELLLDDRRLYVADGARTKGATDWEFAEKGIRCFTHPDAATAKAAYAKNVETLEGKKYVLAGEATPHALRSRLTSERERSGALDAALLPLRKKFEAATTLALADSGGATLSITLDKFNLEIVRNGTKQTMYFPTLANALDIAAIELHVATTQAGYTFKD